jgi:hypothetical protein
MKPELFVDASVGTLPFISETRYMNAKLFIVWLKHFVQHKIYGGRPSVADP